MGVVSFFILNRCQYLFTFGIEALEPIDHFNAVYQRAEFLAVVLAMFN